MNDPTREALRVVTDSLKNSMFTPLGLPRLRSNRMCWNKLEPLRILQTKLTLILIASGEVHNTTLSWMKTTTLELPYTLDFSSLPLSEICANREHIVRLCEQSTHTTPAVNLYSFDRGFMEFLLAEDFTSIRTQVYAVVNITSKQYYVGATDRSIFTRFTEHVSNGIKFRRGKVVSATPLIKALAKAPHEFAIIPLLFPHTSDLYRFETHMILGFDPPLNMTCDNLNLNYNPDNRPTTTSSRKRNFMYQPWATKGKRKARKPSNTTTTLSAQCPQMGPPALHLLPQLHELRT